MRCRLILKSVTVILVVLGLCESAWSGWSEPMPVSEVNTAFDDKCPFLSFDGLVLYFCRRDTDTFYYTRIYQATRPEPYGPFTSVEEISSLNNWGDHVVSPWVSKDNLRMYCWRTETNYRPLAFTERTSTSDPWLPGVDISELSALGYVNDPTLTEDELTIFFVGYNLPGGTGTYDIWTANRPDRNSAFGNIRELTEINSTASDDTSFISSDGLTLYFSSNRNGPFQIFKATRSSLSEPFGNLEHLSFFDTPGGNTAHPCISGDGTAFYFSSALDGEPADIYVSYLIIDPNKASAPSPAHGATNVDPNVVLSWSPGIDANSHNVYFGTAHTDVNEATPDSNEYMGNYAVNSYDPCGLDIVTTYYWRIDEVADTNIYKGDVWSFKTCVEPNLISWWKFDEGSGSIAYDSAGTNDGTIYGATWAIGKINGALSFDGVDDYVEVIDSDNSLDIEDNITITAWVKLDYFNLHDHDYFVGKQPTGTSRTNYPGNYIFRTTPLDGYLHFHHQTGTGENEISKYSSTYSIAAGEWQHVSVTLVEGGNVNFYIDGSPAGTVPQSGTFGLLNDEPVRIGTRKDEWSYFFGTIDDVRIYNKALSVEEVLQLCLEGWAGKAFSPDPGNEQWVYDTNIVLSWIPGLDANEHDVYFGEDFNDVNDANTITTLGVYKGRIDVNFFDVCDLEPYNWYYWRIDEVNEPNIYRGNIWSFYVSGPIIDLSDTSFSFLSLPDGPDPDPQTLGISNNGTGTLNWQISYDCSWLTVEPNNGSSTGEVNEVNLIVDTSGLGWGLYSCDLTISDPCAENNPQTVHVNLDVPGPVIGLSETQFWFSFDPGGENPDDQILEVTNSGFGTLNWQIGYNCNWLDVEPTSGSSSGEPNGVTLSVDTSGLDPSIIYTCLLIVSDANATNNPQIITITLECFPSDHPDYPEWVVRGKPDCWCYPRQCHGDADGEQEGVFIKKWVSLNDLSILIANWQDAQGTAPQFQCANFDHYCEGTFMKKYTSTNDLAILIANWQDAQGSPPDCLNVP